LALGLKAHASLDRIFQLRFSKPTALQQTNLHTTIEPAALFDSEQIMAIEALVCLFAGEGDFVSLESPAPLYQQKHTMTLWAHIDVLLI
jgi:hypothetical protein